MRVGSTALLFVVVLLHTAPAGSQSGGANAALFEITGSVAGGANLDPSLSNQSAEAMHAEGVRLLREQKLEAAIQHFAQAAALDKQSALYVTDLGYAYLKQRRLLEAEAAFKKGIELDPSRPHAYEHLEQSITQQPQRWEKRQELLRILEQGLAANPDPATRSRIELARIRTERSFGLVERAISHIDDLLQRKDVSRTTEKQLRDLRRSVEQDKKARALRDWPVPQIEPTDASVLADCKRTNDPAGRKAALSRLAELVWKYPAWRDARALRAQILAAQGHYDEAVKELTILLRLAPSEPNYHRQLGVLLAEHGGLLELERADTALRIAQALEPEWTELEAVRQKLAERRYDSQSAKRRTKSSVPSPSEEAVRLYGEAEAKLEQSPVDTQAAKDLLNQALRISPGYVEAAALSFSLTHHIAEATVRALWDSASGMYSMYQEFARVEPPAPRISLDAWLNRAIELGNVEGLLSRALDKKRRGELQAAELDLGNYLALVTNDEEVQAVQTLRAELVHKRQDLASDILLNARFRLEEGDAEGALRILEAPCRADQDGARLLQLGMVYERQGQLDRALDCYELELAKGNPGAADAPIARRLVRILGRCDSGLFKHAAARRLGQLSTREPAGSWVLARLALDAGNPTEARGQLAIFLAHVEPGDSFIPAARELDQRLRTRAQLVQEDQRRSRQRLVALALTGLPLSFAIVYLFLFRGSTVARAIRRRPRLFPELSRLLGELRHDVLKHRTSALELVKDNQASFEQLRKTMLEPIPTSAVVTEAYARLADRARALGLTLRRLRREPVFGPFVKDLKQVERSLTGTGNPPVIVKIDARLRQIHQARLTQLLKLGPSCQLDAVEIQRWIAAVEAEGPGKRMHWTAPALHMSHPTLKFPVDRATLFLVFANLLRNAEAATQGLASPKIQVGLTCGVDFTGRQQVRLRVSDNASGTLTEETIELQAADRGLGILRDAVREWHGVLTVAPEQEPFTKSVGVQFAP